MRDGRPVSVGDVIPAADGDPQSSEQNGARMRHDGGRMEGLLRRVFERHPRRYPDLVVAGAIPLVFLATVTAEFTLILLFDATRAQFIRLVVVGLLLSFVCLGVTYATALPRLRPVFRYLGGAHDTGSSVASFVAASDLYPIVRRGVIVYSVAFAGYNLWALEVLDASLVAYPGFMAGITLAIVWAAMMILLWFDYAIRPAMMRGWEDLPPDFVPPPPTLSAERKLLFSSTMFAAANIAWVAAFVIRLDLDPPVALPLLVTIAVVASFTVARVGNAFMVLSVFRPVKDLIAASKAVGRGDLSMRVALTSGDEFGHLAASFNQMVRGLAERQALQSALGSYVDPIVAERLLAEGELLDGEYADVTVLFLDIRGFTALSEHQDAADTVSDLNRLFGRVVPLVAECGGHVNKFTGDGLLAVFGTPEHHADHADRAVRSARRIAAMMTELYSDTLRVGIGINSGKVVAGTIGGGGHLEFAVIGDAVNVASRIESLTKETGDAILVSSATRERLRDSEHRLVPRGDFTLRGRSGTTNVYALDLGAPYSVR